MTKTIAFAVAALFVPFARRERRDDCSSGKLVGAWNRHVTQANYVRD